MNCDFTQENKVPVRSHGMCLGEDDMVFVSYTLVSPTFKLDHVVALAAA